MTMVMMMMMMMMAVDASFTNIFQHEVIAVVYLKGKQGKRVR